jgi:tRNA pseudouridine38-40 synthase
MTAATVIRLLLAYDGTDFHGWARQREVRTVQGVLEDALARVLRVRAELSVAGRTDAGVHAQGQVASFVAADGCDTERLRRAVNDMLAPEVVVRAARPAPAGFDARRSAIARVYRYRISTDHVPDPFSARYVWQRPGRLSVAPMRAAARRLVGEHDFRSFCRAPSPPGSTVRRLERLSVAVTGHDVVVGARANAFLHQMVRSLVGTLVAVGEGRTEPWEIPAILEARNRSSAGPVAPARGLTLERVVYPGAVKRPPRIAEY